MALARTQREWAILVGEYNICKKKLESKREALKIITKEWQALQQERDIYKNKINQLQQDLERCVSKDKQQSRVNHQNSEKLDFKCTCLQTADFPISPASKDSFAQLVVEYKAENKALRKDLLELKRLYVESQEDVQILRERMRRQSSSSSVGDEGSTTSGVEGKEELIIQLEEYKEQVASLEQELKSIRDENSDISTERDHYKDKCERLNTQLNYILGADDRRLVDVDALVLDNKYLKEKLAQIEEERNLEKESIQKYEAVFEKKKNKLLHRGSIGDRVSSYYSKYNTEHSLKTVSDLRNVANVLSETITEKNLALSHQRNANRILGRRVSELENKLKTLEVAGLWSLPGHRGYGSVNLENIHSDKIRCGVDTSNEHLVTPSGAVRGLDPNHNSDLVELIESEKGNTTTQGKGTDFRDSSKILDVSIDSRESHKSNILSKSSAKKTSVAESFYGSSGNMEENGSYRNGFISDNILNHCLDLEKLSKRDGNGASHEESSLSSRISFYSVLCSKDTSVCRRITRSVSAPCLTRTQVFEVKDHHVSGVPS